MHRSEKCLVVFLIIFLKFGSILAKYVIGMDAGTESIRVGIFDLEGKLFLAQSVPYQTLFPKPGWAEQNPHDWYESMGNACRKLLKVSGILKEDILSLALDSTACSVVALDKDHNPLRPCLLWMDARSAPQTAQILQDGIDDPALQVNCGGKGPLSAEWMIPKSLWIKQNEPHIWNDASTICEKQDYLNFRLTNRMCASGCNVAARWHWDANLACTEDSNNESFPGRPISLLSKIGLEDILTKWPLKCVPMSSVVGPLTKEGANHLGLCEGIPVCQGGPDAYVGMIGLGCVSPDQLSLITGSSHLHLCVGSSESTRAPGIWGAYNGAPLLGLCFAEGGQSSTGSVLSWAKRLFSTSLETDGVTYAQLDEEATLVPVGAEGLLALETFQGSRTPITDPLARGALIGLSLAHTRGHIWRALLESICFGTRAALEALYAAGYGQHATELLVAGGATRSAFWLQMHADVTGLPIVVGEFDNAPLLGAAILAAVGGGIYANVQEAVKAMVRPYRRIEPRPEVTAQYDIIFDTYRRLAPSLQPLVHQLSGIKTEGKNSFGDNTSPPPPSTVFTESLDEEHEDEGGEIDNVDEYSNLSSSVEDTVMRMEPVKKVIHRLPSGRRAVIVPSLLAADMANLGTEIKLCEHIDAGWVHVDVCDGGTLCQGSLTFGSIVVAALHREAPHALMDVHVVAEDPFSQVLKMAAAGAHRFIFQWESLSSPQHALELAKAVRKSGMRCGVCVAPDTAIENVIPFLNEKWEQLLSETEDDDSGSSESSLLIDFVDILAVYPGIGGQKFEERVLEKVKKLYTCCPHLPYIAVDGGINDITAKLAASAGANVLIAGSSIFGSHRKALDGTEGMVSNISNLMKSLLAYGV